MTSKKKKVFILLGMVALLVLTGVLNIVLNNTLYADNPVDGDLISGNFYESYRADRTTSREQSFLYYDSIIQSDTSSAEAKAAAEAAKLELTNSIETELVVEGLIMALGYTDAVVTTTTENIYVIVKCEELTSQEAAQILQIVMSETNAVATGVRIIPSE